MAIEAAQTGGSMPTVFNAANELAVRKFLQKKISFLDIYEIIGQSMSRHTAVRIRIWIRFWKSRKKLINGLKAGGRLKIIIAMSYSVQSFSFMNWDIFFLQS